MSRTSGIRRQPAGHRYGFIASRLPTTVVYAWGPSRKNRRQELQCVLKEGRCLIILVPRRSDGVEAGVPYNFAHADCLSSPVSKRLVFKLSGHQRVSPNCAESLDQQGSHPIEPLTDVD